MKIKLHSSEKSSKQGLLTYICLQNFVCNLYIVLYDIIFASHQITCTSPPIVLSANQKSLSISIFNYDKLNDTITRLMQVSTSKPYLNHEKNTHSRQNVCFNFLTLHSQSLKRKRKQQQYVQKKKSQKRCSSVQYTKIKCLQIKFKKMYILNKKFISKRYIFIFQCNFYQLKMRNCGAQEH